MHPMEERRACALLKARFEQAGFAIAENQAFDEDGIRFEIDGFDAARRVGYEYLTSEAGDSWDVDGDVIAALDDRRKKGELHILVVDEADAPDEAALTARADAFLAALPKAPAPAPAKAAKPAAKPPAKPKAKKKPAKKR
jgi:hypothetical protein